MMPCAKKRIKHQLLLLFKASGYGGVLCWESHIFGGIHSVNAPRVRACLQRRGERFCLCVL